jgi:hypothetical protein
MTTIAMVFGMFHCSQQLERMENGLAWQLSVD